MRVLLTGFDDHGRNITGVVARKLNGTRVGGAAIIGRTIDHRHGEFGGALEKLIRRAKPEVVIATGQAGGRAFISLEKVAHRLYYHRERKRETEGTVKGQQVGYLSTLPLRQIRTALQKDGIPADYSFGAGSWYCNEVFYDIMRIAQERGIRTAGFIHTPFTHDQVIAMKNVSIPSMDGKTIEKAIRIAISISLKRP